MEDAATTEPATLAAMIFLRPDKESWDLPEGRSGDKVCFAKILGKSALSCDVTALAYFKVN